MVQYSLKIIKSCVIWYIFRWAGGRVTRRGCVDGWVGGISIIGYRLLEGHSPGPRPHHRGWGGIGIRGGAGQPWDIYKAL